MRVQITKRIGKSTLNFVVEAEKEVDALAKASFYTMAPDKCGLCGSEDLVLESNRAQGFTFVKIHCVTCNGRSQLGQFKDGSGCFWKRFEKYDAQAAQPTTQPASTVETKSDIEEEYPGDEDIPF